MANMRYNPDHSTQTRAGTYADVGDEARRPITSQRRYTTTDRRTVDAVMSDVDDEEYLIDTSVETVRVDAQEDDMSVGRDYTYRRPRRHTTYTDPNIRVSGNNNKTVPTRYVNEKIMRVDIQPRRGKKPLTFYVGSALALVTAGLIGWNVLVLPAVDHWHNGDDPTRYSTIKVNNELCDVQAAYLSNKVVVNIIPADVNHKAMGFEMTVATNKNGEHIVTVKAGKDANGHDDLQTYVDGIAGPKIVNDGHGFKIEE